MKKKKLLQLIALFAVSGFFLYITFNDFNFSEIPIKFKQFNLLYFPLAIVLALISIFIRSLRWGVILSSFKPINQRILFPITSVGLLAITILPFRTGEVARPFLINKASGIPFSSALTTIVVERFLDMLMILLLIFFIINFSNVPSWVSKIGLSLLILVCSLSLIFIVIYKTKALIKKYLIKANIRLSNKFKLLINEIFDNLLLGFSIFFRPKELLNSLLLSLGLWIIYGLIVYVMFLFHSFEFSIVSSFSVMTISYLSILVPSAPGFLGTFQFASSSALSIFGASSQDAALFSITYYLALIGTNIIVGLIFLPFVSLEKNIFNEIDSNKEVK